MRDIPYMIEENRILRSVDSTTRPSSRTLRRGTGRSSKLEDSFVIVLLNPTAVGADKLKADIAERFVAAGSKALIIELQQGQDPAEVARTASARTSIVVAAGGDGTVSRVAAGLVGTPAVLGVLPLGTLNHFAKDLRIPLDLENAVATIAAPRVGIIDVGRVNERVFLNNSSIGIYPNIIQAREELRRLGHRKWPAFALATFRVLRRYRGVFVRIEADGRQSVWRTPFVFVGNNEYELDGIRLGGRTRLDGGRLFTYLAPRVPNARVADAARKSVAGARQTIWGVRDRIGPGVVD